jgi:anti-anti-sigma factor
MHDHLTARAFRLDTQHDDSGQCVLALAGEFDMAAAPVFQRALDAAIQRDAKSVTVDLSALTFIDSTGLRAVLEGRQLCAERRVEYWLAPEMARPVKRLLEIAGVASALPFA